MENALRLYFLYFNIVLFLFLYTYKYTFIYARIDNVH